eukprot:Pgem_evm1s6553
MSSDQGATFSSSDYYVSQKDSNRISGFFSQVNLEQNLIEDEVEVDSDIEDNPFMSSTSMSCSS